MTTTNTRPAHREHGNGYYPSEAELRKARGNAVRVAVYCIEGESVTLQQVADRLGLSKTQASTRLRRERNRAPAVTWEGLAR